MSFSQLTSKESEEEKAEKTKIREDEPLKRLNKRKANDITLDQGKNEGHVASLVLYLL